MSAIAAKKREEGEVCMRAAEKAKKTSPMKLKFSPDWESAYAEYEKAASWRRRTGATARGASHSG